jgi:phosphohistidine phosphatase
MYEPAGEGRRRLILLRHAKSSWDDNRLEDFDRPLSWRGERAAAAMAVYCAQRGVAPNLVLCSPALRTRMTWRSISGALPEPDRLMFPTELYDAGARDIWETLTAHSRGAREILHIGHNPGLQDLARSLAGRSSEPGARDAIEAKFPTAALAVFDLHFTVCKDLESREVRVVDFKTPKQLV